jgi:tryptophanyl-tRNA synthetase
VRSKVRAAVTDTGDPDAPIGEGARNLLAILRACGRHDQAAAFEDEYAQGRPRRYAPLKDAVADALVALTSGLRLRRAALSADPQRVRRLIREGAEKARAIAQQTMRDVRRLTGVMAGSDL